ncbi:Glycosyltransferase, catalytic subunit of cellulose synthase and poly-beta-1,6-N-acetylglucosamine synthase [Seinonella peptonophila]|uniref:Glycosyltransferase, catalytic subunit of cellulose synthase and poly-beta-1,6-N-acetylglucosamine synthase n=1 Tax=Seinonella peptonophila TaxID=112248 RepID=A0A1M5BBD6_9BACL|nr:glycosyltransferase [Seinonella peptonophila]SHF39472.1 Glycosyltransferase, catalytic subunit of cellulose synthase and poly-beta-1,6-N-acetylglucosamine synthase [Seinonella peptonophila]
MSMSVIIPLLAEYGDGLRRFANYIVSISSQVEDYEFQFVIADESEQKAYQYLANRLQESSNVVHFAPSPESRTGANDKMNGVYAALEYAQHDKIFLMDDDYRASKETLIKVHERFEQYDIFKAMPKFNRFTINALIDLSGMFVINVLDPRKQYCGHNAFRKHHILQIESLNRDALFDEYVIEAQLREAGRLKGYRIGFAKDIGLEATQEITASKFFEQRVRYAYENLAFPWRFIGFACILPLLIALGILNITCAIWLATCLTLGILTVSFIGQLIYGATIVAPYYTFLWSIAWFWFYPFTTWIALYKRVTGGVRFGGKKILRAK